MNAINTLLPHLRYPSLDDDDAVLLASSVPSPNRTDGLAHCPSCVPKRLQLPRELTWQFALDQAHTRYWQID